MERNKCESCFWYADCLNRGLIEENESCDFFDNIEEQEDFWEEMSYRKYERGD